MSVEYTIWYDGCGNIIDANRRSAAAAREGVRAIGGRVNLAGGMDLCPHCVADGTKAGTRK